MTTATIPHPTTTDWTARQAAARIPFQVIDGLPVNPVQPDLPDGRGELHHLGERACADAVVFVTVAGRRWLLLGRRDDGHGWAFPGGGLEDDETDLGGALRELWEETGLLIDPDDPTVTVSVGSARYVPDPRADRHSWMVTTLVVLDLGERSNFPNTRAGSDLLDTAWFDAQSAAAVKRAIRHRDPAGKVFFSHDAVLTELLGAG